MLKLLGHNLDSASFKETPKRFAKFMQDFSPNKEEPAFTVFPANNQNLVIIRDLEVRSMCAHHLAPFFGKCTIAYYPSNVIAGLSKFQRTLDYISKEPTEQEALTQKISDYLYKKLKTPKGLAIIMEAQHTCMIVRGVHVSGSTTQTISTRGIFEEKPQLLNLILNK